MFLIGLALWVATVVVTVFTGNPNLIPTVVLLGSFLVPVTFVAWAFERRETGELTGGLLFSTFVTGGVLGILAASVLEAYLLAPSPLLFLGVGLIEEAVKLAALAVLTRHLAVKSVRDGMILGAAVGFGFAAFESAGYAFTALHALWDSMHSLALLLTLILTTGETYSQGDNGWIVSPTAGQARLFPVLEYIGLAIISVIGVAWLLVMWRRHRRALWVPAPPGWRVPTRTAVPT
jgi:RsiW-degrading membrane proteinase PrsW (M82 family)